MAPAPLKYASMLLKCYLARDRRSFESQPCVIRVSSQALLETLCGVFSSGFRRGFYVRNCWCLSLFGGFQNCTQDLHTFNALLTSWKAYCMV